MSMELFWQKCVPETLNPFESSHRKTNKYSSMKDFDSDEPADQCDPINLHGSL